MGVRQRGKHKSKNTTSSKTSRRRSLDETSNGGTAKSNQHSKSPSKSTTNGALSNGSSKSKRKTFLIGMAFIMVAAVIAAVVFGPNIRSSLLLSLKKKQEAAIIKNKKKSTDDDHENTKQTTTRHGSYELLERVPHDPMAFTQGLEMKNQTHYYESLGLYGESSVRLVEVATGKPVLETVMEEEWFGEGLCRYSMHSNGNDIDERLMQLTWKENQTFIYDAQTLQELKRIPYNTSTSEGWGIAFDQARNCMYVTDGSSLLHTWNVPEINAMSNDVEDELRISESRSRVEVFMTRSDSSRIPIKYLNELEYDEKDGGTLLANVWFQDAIIRIDPDTGFVRMVYNLQSLYPREKRPPTADVLNGIALVPNSPDGNEVWVTGKKWKWMYRIRLIDDL